MTLSELLRQGILTAVASYVHPEDTSETARTSLVTAAAAAEDDLDLEAIRRDADALEEAEETGRRIDALEALTSKVARGIAIAAVRARLPQGLSDDEAEDRMRRARTWISGNITARSAEAFRVKAIWRHAAGLGSHHDAAIFEHAIDSALGGETIQPAPGADPATNPATGTEAKMIDPTDTRNAILDVAAFNPAGLPKALRTAEGQQIYLDAVVHATALLGHPPDEDDADAWAGMTAALMLLDGHYNPRDRRFFAHAQKAVAELSSSADEGGQIQIDNHVLPATDEHGNPLPSNLDDQGQPLPVNMIAPDQNTTQRYSVFRKAFDILREHADTGDGRVFLQSFALAGRRAVERFELHKGDAKVMSHLVRATYDDHVTQATTGGNGGGGIADLAIPPLYDPAGYNEEIEPDNIRSVATIYVTYQLEFALKATGRLLDLFVAGLLPISASDTSARALDRLYWDLDELPDEASRRSVYARVLGAPGGEMAFDIQPNSEFNTLLMRVVSAVSEYEREQSILTHFDNAGRGRRFQSTSGEFVRKAIRDFAANVSLRGWAGTTYTAERMASFVNRVMQILNLPSVKNAFGVTTPWQVVERVSQREFGITVNTVLHRTLAVETQKIMGIIADNHTVWSAGERPLFPEIDLRRGAGRTSLQTVIPGDLSAETTRELMVACQHFRAVTGVGDALLDEYSEPVETAAQPSLPDIGGIGGMAGGGAMPSLDMGGISQLRDMVNSGQAPSLEQLRSMLPGF